MSDVLPKIKLYLFISLIQLVINIGIIICNLATTNTYSSDFTATALISGAVGVSGAFVPFISLISLALVGFPAELNFLFGIATGIFSALQTLIIFLLILQMVSNILWSPDV